MGGDEMEPMSSLESTVLGVFCVVILAGMAYYLILAIDAATNPYSKRAGRAGILFLYWFFALIFASVAIGPAFSFLLGMSFEEGKRLGEYVFYAALVGFWTVFTVEIVKFVRVKRKETAGQKPEGPEGM